MRGGVTGWLGVVLETSNHDATDDATGMTGWLAGKLAGWLGDKCNFMPQTAHCPSTPLVSTHEEDQDKTPPARSSIDISTNGCGDIWTIAVADHALKCKAQGRGYVMYSNIELSTPAPCQYHVSIYASLSAIDPCSTSHHGKFSSV